MMRASSGAKSAEMNVGKLSARYFSSRSSPTPPAGRVAHPAVPHVAITPSTTVKARRLTGASTAQAVCSGQLDLLEITDCEIGRLLIPVLGGSGAHEDRV